MCITVSITVDEIEILSHRGTESIAVLLALSYHLCVRFAPQLSRVALLMAKPCLAQPLHVHLSEQFRLAKNFPYVPRALVPVR